MNDFVVHSKLMSTIVDDHDSHATTAVRKRFIEPRPQTTLINYSKSLLDISSLSHRYNPPIVANIKHTICLEDRTQHILHNHRRCRIGDEARLLLQLLREEIHAQIAILTSLSGCGNTNDLAGATLQD